MLNRSSSGRIMAGAVALALVGLATDAQSQTVTLTDGTSSTFLNFGSPALQSSWIIQGQEQLNQAGGFYRIDNNAEASLSTLGAATISTYNGTRGVVATYTAGQFTLQLDYLLTGGNVGEGKSSIAETIKISNTSGAALNFHFFQYSDFDLGGTSVGDDVTLNTIGGQYYVSSQTKAGVGMVQTVNTPGANHGEAALSGVTLAKLTDGVADNLSDIVAAGPGDVTWALQWDLVIAPGGTVTIIKGTTIDLQVIPEPSTLALVGLGLAGLAFRRHRRIS